MNWTAILALIAVNAFLGFLLWCAEDRASEAHSWRQHANIRAHEAEMRSIALLQKLEESQTLHRNLLARQHRKGQRDTRPETAES